MEHEYSKLPLRVKHAPHTTRSAAAPSLSVRLPPHLPQCSPHTTRSVAAPCLCASLLTFRNSSYAVLMAQC